MSSLTEKEARRKWCPEARVSLYHRATDANRMVRYGSGVDSEDHVAFEAATRCIASDCMMWQWHDHPEGHRLFGRCGKAGKP